MNEKTHTASGAGDRGKTRPRHALPVWLWILLVAVLVAIVILLAIPLIMGNGSDTEKIPMPTASAEATEAPTPTPSAIQSPTPTPPPNDLGQGTFDNGFIEYMADVLNSQNTAVLDQGGTFSNPVSVRVANNGAAVDMTPAEAVKAMEPMFTPLDPNPWDLSLAQSVLESYRSGPYGDYFPQGAIVAKSHDGHVFSFIGHGATITTMFMAASETLL